ncbi:VOC family protein [Rhodococcus sp. H36-A4]|uniref:VOC family protein n=1 Tax=Rhodococcus sp. H36-A4 TaxID=3004353 RepID=UPI0022AF2670|nr:VOC family protein [Rhodococcus sp. H36-A4]MCZ4077604.1 VOC family protein [Rhodococcus sp. H36-A4]
MPTIELTRAPFTGFAVDDIEAARIFYSDVLGLTIVEGEMGLINLQLSESNEVLIYPRPNHVPAAYTILNFPVADIESAVDALTAKGVMFEHYPDMATDERGIFRHGGPLIAWFTDPAGNILSVLQA